jgi:TonB-dependent SusC/RagA subfamily outer membrane receptor
MKQFIFLKISSSVFFLQLLFAPALFSQDITVQGNVQDTFNRPLADVNVKVKGGSVSVFTDSAGNYKIIAPAKGKLVFSRKGFETKKASIKGATTLNISLAFDLKNLSGLDINTGFGTVKESQTAQSVASVDKNAIEKDNTTDITQLLESVPGVKVVNSGGELKILIRGIRSLNSDNFALVVLNGSTFYGSLKDLNRNDIKSIDVLKDPSSTAAYGSRGANGVVLITTK